jgi:hypothetical protein
MTNAKTKSRIILSLRNIKIGSRDMEATIKKKTTKVNTGLRNIENSRNIANSSL